MVSSLKDAAGLGSIGRLRRERTPLPSSAFFCLLDEQPTHLVPRRFVTELQQKTGESLIVNPECIFSCYDLAPQTFTLSSNSRPGFALQGLTLQGNIAWVVDRSTGIHSPFWLGRELSSLLWDIPPGAAPPSHIPPHLYSILTYAGILTTQDFATQRATQWGAILRHCRHQFARGFVPIGRLIHPFHIAALRRYYRYRIRHGLMRLGDNQSERRYIAHNDSVARFFHEQLTGVVAQIAGRPLKPSYVYFSSYLGGSELEKHNDRPQCEYSISFCLDYSPEPYDHTPWPLHLNTKQEHITVYQAIGDGLLYRGRLFPHYRRPLYEGHTSSHLFFHYVDAGFDGPLD